jgi:hypothetical protein
MFSGIYMNLLGAINVELGAHLIGVENPLYYRVIDTLVFFAHIICNRA